MWCRATLQRVKFSVTLEQAEAMIDGYVPPEVQLALIRKVAAKRNPPVIPGQTTVDEMIEEAENVIPFPRMRAV